MKQSKNAVTLSMLAVLVSLAALPSAGRAGPQDSLTPGLYDPERDVYSTGLARWLYLGTLFYQAPLWSQGLVVGFGFEPFDNKAQATQLLVTPATFFGFLWMTRGRTITPGMVTLSANGAVQGAAAGLLVGDLLMNWNQQEYPKAVALTTVAGSVGGHIVGFRHAGAERLNAGNADMLAQAGGWSLGYSAYLASLLVPWRELDGIPWNWKVVEVTGLAGWGAGLYLWHKHAPRDYTTGDAISTWNTTGLGILSAFAAYSLLPESWRASGTELGDKTSSLVPALVNAGGLYYGYRFHRNRDLAFGQSLLVSLGSVLGATGIGGAAALFLTPEGQTQDYRLSLTTAAVGGWAGFHLAHYLLNTGEERAGRADAGIPGFRVRLMPENLTGLLLAAKNGSNCRVPLLALEF